jgi:hypothetical protein
MKRGGGVGLPGKRKAPPPLTIHIFFGLGDYEETLIMALSPCLEVSEYSHDESAQATMLLSRTTE